MKHLIPFVLLLVLAYTGWHLAGKSERRHALRFLGRHVWFIVVLVLIVMFVMNVTSLTTMKVL